MKLPKCGEVVVPREKVVDYLLSQTHPVGRSKAKFFRGLGFHPADWEMLADALKQVAMDNEVSGTEPSPFGTRYIVEGPLETADGENPVVRTVWFIEKAREVPRFVTAYPLPRKQVS